MTEQDRREEVRANWDRAEESLAAAAALLDSGYADIAASRAYYAAFYAACALLLSADKRYSKHSGVLAAVHRDFVRTGRLADEHGRVLNWLSELRGIADYGESRHVPEDEAREAILGARRFLEGCGQLLGGKGFDFCA